MDAQLQPGTLATVTALLVSTLLITACDIHYNGVLNDALVAITDYGRDWSTVASIVALIFFACIGRYRPCLLNHAVLSIIAVILQIAGTALIHIGVLCAEAIYIHAGLSLTEISSAYVTLIWLIGLSKLDRTTLCAMLVIAFFLSFPVAWLLGLPKSIWIADCIYSLVALVLLFPLAKSTLAEIRSLEPRPDDAVAQPAAFVSFGSRLYIYIFVFSFAYGYSMRYMVEVDQIVSYLLALPVMAVLLGIIVLKHHAPHADGLFAAAFAIFLVGFLLLLLDDSRCAGAATGLLEASYNCFELLIWFVLCAIAGRTLFDAVPALSWGLAANYLGIFTGALLGIITENVLVDESRFLIRLMLVVFLGAAVLFIQLNSRTFSFDEVIAGVVSAPRTIEVCYVDGLEERCRDASRKFSLTARESEVLELLARGNRAAHIQEALSISRNTVKYHARNVYAKLGVHSQQELIDLLAESNGSCNPNATSERF